MAPAQTQEACTWHAYGQTAVAGCQRAEPSRRGGRASGRQDGVHAGLAWQRVGLGQPR